MDEPMRICRAARIMGIVLLVVSCGWPCLCPAAKIELKNGRSLEGLIIEETEEQIRIRLTGSSMVIALDRAAVKEVVRDEGILSAEVDGDQRRSRGEFQQARDFYRAALQQQSTDPAAQERLNRKIDECTTGIVAANHAELDRAYARALELVQRNGFDKISLGLDLLSEFPVEGSPGGLEGVSVRDVDRKKARLFAEKARRELDRLSYEQASASLDEAVRYGSDLAELYMMRGDLALKIGFQQDKAITNYTRGLELAGEQLPAVERARYHFNLGRLLRSRGRNDEAIVHLMKTIDLAPDQFREAAPAAAEAYLVVIAADEGLAEKADTVIATLQRLIDLNPGGLLAVRLRQRLADLYFIKGQPDKAIEELRNIVASFPNLEEINYRIAKSYFDLSEKAKAQGDATQRQAFLDKAEQSYLREIAINAKNYEAMCDLAGLYLETFRLEKARDILIQALKLEPTKWRAHYFAMHVYKRLGDRLEDGKEEYDRALTHAKEFIALRGERHPEYYDAMILQAIIMIKRKQYAEAEGMLTVVFNALSQTPEPALTPLERRALSSAYNYRGQIVLEKDQAVYDAKDKYEKALALDNQNADAHGNMAEAWKRLAALRAANPAERDEMFRKAEAESKRAIEIEPDNPDRYQALGILYYRDMKRADKALVQFKEYEARGGTSPQVRKYISDIEKTTE